MYVYKYACVNMYKYNLSISTKIPYSFIQQFTGKLLQHTKTHIDQFMIRYKKIIRNNQNNICKNNVIT